jgi:hypothetical protein
MYRGPMDVAVRADQIKEIARQMDVIEGIMAGGVLRIST